MLVDREYRKDVISHITDPGVKSFWEGEFANYTDRFAQDATPAIQNKVGQFTANPVIRNIIGQPKSTFNIRQIMDDQKILIINLSKGQVGEDSANLLGSMLITKIYLAAMSRADLRETELNKLPNFYLYVDEFQSFANESFADILSEARKYKLNLTIAHQYIEQMSDEVRAAVFGNVGTMVSFRVGAIDAEYLEKEFVPAFTAEDLVNLGAFKMYLKLMIDGMASAPFSAGGLPPIEPPSISYRDVVIARSRSQFSRQRAVVENEILKWHQKEYGKQAFEKKDNDVPKEKRRGDDPRTQKFEGKKPLDRWNAPRQDSERERELRKAVSLSNLRHSDFKKHKQKKKSKGPSQAHLSELRAALNAVVGEAQANSNKQEIPSTQKKEEHPQKTLQSESLQQQSQKQQKPQEVPEQVLKDLFKTKEEK
jgi:hypothetical protein